MDEAVLAALRATRQEIQHLAERVGSAATREVLSGYVTVEAFKSHERGHEE